MSKHSSAEPTPISFPKSVPWQLQKVIFTWYVTLYAQSLTSPDSICEASQIITVFVPREAVVTVIIIQVATFSIEHTSLDRFCFAVVQVKKSLMLKYIYYLGLSIVSEVFTRYSILRRIILASLKTVIDRIFLWLSQELGVQAFTRNKATYVILGPCNNNCLRLQSLFCGNLSYLSQSHSKREDEKKRNVVGKEGHLLPLARVKSEIKECMNTLFCHLSLLTPCLYDCSADMMKLLLSVWHKDVNLVEYLWDQEYKIGLIHTNQMFESLNRSYLSSCFVNDNPRVEQGIWYILKGCMLHVYEYANNGYESRIRQRLPLQTGWGGQARKEPRRKHATKKAEKRNKKFPICD